MSSLLEAALAAFETGWPVIAVRANKCPYRAGWNDYFARPQTEQEVRDQFSNGAWGIAKVLFPACDDVHLDFDGMHAEQGLKDAGIVLPLTARQITAHGSHLIFGNGKSTLDNSHWRLGPDYTQQLKAEILGQSKYANAEYHIAELCGVRIGLACEID